jgi:enoyl-CoA hydratase
MESMSVRIERDGPIVIIVLSRQHARNAVDGPTAAALADAFRTFDGDETASVAVLWGEGGNFCAGADLKAIGTPLGNRLSPEGDGPMGPTRMLLSKPVIAAISGYAVAGGLELALWCDLRVADESAVFGVFCRRWGVPLVDGGTVRLPRLIGMGRAMDLILTGRPVPAKEAFEMGLTNYLVSDQSALEFATSLAHDLARFPQTCLRRDRLSMLEQEGLAEAEAMRIEFEHGMISAASMADGLARFASGAGRHGQPD